MQEQYFDLRVSSPPESKEKKSINLTKYIYGRSVVYTDEDGKIKTLVFTLDSAYLLMDVLSLGMVVDFVGGTRKEATITFKGDIKKVKPEFGKSGDVSLEVTCFAIEGKGLGVGVKDLLYPMKNHPRNWATGSLTYSDIIVNLAKDSNFKVLSENIKVKKDVEVTHKKPVRQKNETDWAFSQRLAAKIATTMWIESDGRDSFIHLEQDSSLVSKVSDHTFFFASKKANNDFIDFTHTSPKQIQFVDVTIDLDRDNDKKGISVTTDPTTGKSVIGKVEEDEEGNLVRWVLDEEKLTGLSSDERRELIELFVSGKITWEGGAGTVSAKSYFKEVVDLKSSREGIPTNTEVVEVEEGAAISKTGVNSGAEATKRTGTENFKTEVHLDKLKKLSTEERTGIMGRIFRGEATEKDKQYYTVKSSSTTENKTDETAPKNTGNTNLAVGDTTAKAKKRDAGFKITGLIYGNTNIRTKLSYILEGLGKYSDKYYLYKIEYIWGNKGFLMQLIFVK